MSQARIGLDRTQKVQRPDANFRKARGAGAETAPCGGRICGEGGVVLQIFPRRRRPRCICPMRRGRSGCARDRRGSLPGFRRGARGGRPALLLTRRMRLSRRSLGSGWPVRPDRLGGSCRFLVPIERREPRGEMVQDWLVGDVDELLHAASHSVVILTTRSGEAASTLKIVRDNQPAAGR